MAIACVAGRNSFASTTRDDVPASGYAALTAQPFLDPVANIYTLGNNTTSNIGNGNYSGAYNVGNADWNTISASGVLVAPNWILTAAHVVDGYNNFFQTSSAANVFDVQFNGTNVYYTASESYVFPEYTGFIGDGLDLALIRIGIPFAQYPLPTPATLDAAAVTAGTTVTMAGYGLTGTGLSGGQGNGAWPYGALPQLNAVQNVITGDGTNIAFPGVQFDGQHYYKDVLIAGRTDRIFLANNTGDPRDLATTFVAPTSPGSVPPLALEGLTTPGDSGGGFLPT